MKPDNTKETIRLFTALPVLSAVKEELSVLPQKGLNGRWVHPDDFHITLRYLGNVAPENLPDIKAALSRVKRPVFDINLAGTGCFRTGRQAIFYAAVHSTRKVTALAGDINEALAPLGFEMPRKPYIPHVTLARLKTPTGLEQYQKRNEKNIKAHWQAVSFSLFLSADPDEKGARYTALADYPLIP